MRFLKLVGSIEGICKLLKMSLKSKEIIIESNKPFENCKLDRKKYATILTSIVNSYSDGFVLAINNKWGTGKTTFVKMWEQSLKDKKFQTVYFNAWENDFENNPLVALMGELKNIVKKEDNKEFKKLAEKGAVLVKNIAPLLVKSIAEKYLDSKLLIEGLEKLTEGVSEIFEKEVDEYANRKKGIIEFKKSLEEFIKSTNQVKPLIFIIDELDRCRPDYAISVLEQIKHFFTVPGIVFILSIDKIQLGNAVKGVYGSEHIDSDEYLRRFIDIEYSIPEPEPRNYCKYLYDTLDFDSFFKSDSRSKYSEIKEDGNGFLTFSQILFKNSISTLRQQEKIFAHARLVLRTFNDNEYVFPSLFLLLIFIRTLNDTFYNQIKSQVLILEELQEKFTKIFKQNIQTDNVNEIIFVHAHLLYFYNNTALKNKLFEKDDKNLDKLSFFPVIRNEDNNDYFLRILKHLEQKYQRQNINFLLDKIELLESVKN